MIDSFSKVSKFHGPEVIQRPPEILLRMGFDGEDRFEIPLPDHGEQFRERNIPLPHRQMLIRRAAVIVDVDLAQIIAQRLDPNGQGHSAEGVCVAKAVKPRA